MTTISLGKVAFSWKGDYSSSTTYNAQDVVNYNGDAYVCTVDSTTNLTPSTLSNTTSPQTVNITVKVQAYYGSNYFYIDGIKQQTLQLYEGNTYVFDVSDASNATHPLKFSTVSDGTHNSGTEYTTGVTSSGTAGTSNATVTIVVADDAPTLYYYCGNHCGMGGQINTPTYATTTTRTSNWNLFAQGALGVGQASGDLIYFDGSQLQRLPTGNANQVLKIDSTSLLPVWGSTNYRSGLKVAGLPNVDSQTYRKGMSVMEDGTLRLWGNQNSYGNLGDGTTTTRTFPTQAAISNANGFNGVRLESDGSVAKHTLMNGTNGTAMIGDNGHLYVWGYNGYGWQGRGSSNNTEATPFDATADSNNSINGKQAYWIATNGKGNQSYHNFMVLCTDGTAHGCGNNAYGQLGISNTTNQNRFTAVSQTAVKFWKVFSNTDRYCSHIALGAVYGDSLVGGGTVGATTNILTETPTKFRVYFWGYAGDYQDGTNSNTNRTVPTEITFFYTNNHNIVECVGTRHSWFARDAANKLWFWGYPYGGHGGTGTTATTVAPTEVGTDVAEIAVSKSNNGNTCAMYRKTNGDIYTSGYNGYGQLGQGNSNNLSTFTQSTSAPSGITKLMYTGSQNYETAVALTSSGEVWAVGYNGNNACGDGTATNRTTWGKMLIQKEIKDICPAGYGSEGSVHLLATDGTLYGVGYGGSHQNGDYGGNNYATPQPFIF